MADSWLKTDSTAYRAVHASEDGLEAAELGAAGSAEPSQTVQQADSSEVRPAYI